jgi:hypothetical protein
MNFALKLNNNSYYPLSREFIDIITEEDNLDTLEGIDNFTSKHTKEELIESLKRSNIKFSEDLENTEFIIYYYDNEKNRELKVYTSDDIDYLEFNLIEFIYHLVDKNVINQIYNYFNSKNYIPKELKQFTIVLKECSIIQIINDLNSLNYYSIRLLKDYVFNEVLKKLEEKKLKLKNE